VLGGIARSDTRGRATRSQPRQPRHQSQLGNYRRAYGACISGRGYQTG
jgi:hypothetical protein